MGRPIDYTAERESWNVYHLDDGTVLRAKLVITRIERVGTKEDGCPLYKFENALITQVEAAEPAPAAQNND
jgi:hypothetical protein